LGAVAALLLATFIGVLAGGGVAQLFPVRVLKAIAAVGFALMAVRLLWPSEDEVWERFYVGAGFTIIVSSLTQM